jgi:hypothetical protein
MASCQYCGGQLGVDCFNQGDCGWITRQQEVQIAAHEVAQTDQHERDQLKAQLDAANAEITRLHAELAAEALEAVERLEAERAQWKRQGAEEELRRLAARINEKLDIENPQGFKEVGLVAPVYCEGLQECIDYIAEAVDEIKARREAR